MINITNENDALHSLNIVKGITKANFAASTVLAIFSQSITDITSRMKNIKMKFKKACFLSWIWIFVLSIHSCKNTSVENSRKDKKAVNPLEGHLQPHLDHSAYFKDTLISATQVTRKCLTCHPNSAKEVMKTAHWQSG